MTGRAAQESVPIGETVEVAERFPFLRSKTFVGAVKRGIRPGITAALLLEEGGFYAEQKYHWTGLAAAGAILGEGLWAYQIDKERQDRDKGVRI